MKVEKRKFDNLLGKLIAAKPMKGAEIKSPRPKKAIKVISLKAIPKHIRDSVKPKPSR